MFQDHQQVTDLHPLTFLNRQGHNLAVDFGCDYSPWSSAGYGRRPDTFSTRSVVLTSVAVTLVPVWVLEVS